MRKLLYALPLLAACADEPERTSFRVGVRDNIVAEPGARAPESVKMDYVSRRVVPVGADVNSPMGQAFIVTGQDYPTVRFVGADTTSGGVRTKASTVGEYKHDESGVEPVEIWIDGRIAQHGYNAEGTLDLGMEVELIDLGEGRHTVGFTPKDRAGNVGGGTELLRVFVYGEPGQDQTMRLLSDVRQDKTAPTYLDLETITVKDNGQIDWGNARVVDEKGGAGIASLTLSGEDVKCGTGPTSTLGHFETDGYVTNLRFEDAFPNATVGFRNGAPTRRVDLELVVSDHNGRSGEPGKDVRVKRPKR
jgi:hypothetical protein